MTSGSAAGAEGLGASQISNPWLAERDGILGNLKEILKGTTEPKMEVAEATKVTTEQLNQRGVMV